MAHQVFYLVSLVVAAIIVIALVVLQIMELIFAWIKRTEEIEKKWPRLWKFILSPPARIVLLVVAIILLTENLHEVISVEPVTISIGNADLGAKNAEITQLKMQLQQAMTKKDYGPIRQRLASFVNQGTKIRNSICATAVQECDEQRKRWQREVERYLVTHLDESYASRFRASINAIGNPWQDMGAEISELSLLLSELK